MRRKTLVMLVALGAGMALGGDYACSVRDAARLGANLRHPSDHLPVIVDFNLSDHNKDKQE